MPQVNLLDLGCISQVFFSAKLAGLPCELEFAGTEETIISSVQLPLGKLTLFYDISLEKGDFIIIVSSFYEYILSNDFQPSIVLLDWLNANYQKRRIIKKTAYEI